MNNPYILKIKETILKVKNFIWDVADEEIEYYSASLSFYTIFAIIPLLLIVLSIFTNLPTFQEYYGNIKNFIFSNLFPTDTEIVANYIDSFLKNSFKMGVVGFVYVLFTSFLFFKNYEYIISQIFHTKPRKFWEAITVYWTLVTLTPIGVIISFYLSSYVQELLNTSDLTSKINFLTLLPYLIIWLLFFITYKISANMKVSTKTALISSFLASLTWYLAKNIFIYYVFYNKTYASLYGSFSTVMFFFLWIYFSWIIFLYGLKVCYKIDYNSIS